jgi:hypothetical protein
MRKPDPPPGTAAPPAMKRTSSSGRPSSFPFAPDEMDHVVVKRKKSRPRLPAEDATDAYAHASGDEDDGAQADGEYVPPRGPAAPRRRSALPGPGRRGDVDERRHSTAS